MDLTPFATIFEDLTPLQTFVFVAEAAIGLLLLGLFFTVGMRFVRWPVETDEEATPRIPPRSTHR